MKKTVKLLMIDAIMKAHEPTLTIETFCNKEVFLIDNIESASCLEDAQRQIDETTTVMCLFSIAEELGLDCGYNGKELTIKIK